MYDWPEVAASTNRYWAMLAESLSDHGFSSVDIPATLKRDSDPHADWLLPDLLLSQTCGLPYVTQLRGKVTLLGRPHFDIQCEAGNYFSVIIARRDAEFSNAGDFEGKWIAYNDPRSQSGFSALQNYLSEIPVCISRLHFIQSQSHRNSIKYVAGSIAEIAAIDAVTWELAKRHEPAAADLKVIAKTKTTPGLPYITSRAFTDKRQSINNAISSAFECLPAAVRDDLLLVGYKVGNDADYDCILNQWERLAALKMTVL